MTPFSPGDMGAGGGGEKGGQGGGVLHLSAGGEPRTRRLRPDRRLTARAAPALSSMGLRPNDARRRRRRRRRLHSLLYRGRSGGGSGAPSYWKSARSRRRRARRYTREVGNGAAPGGGGGGGFDSAYSHRVDEQLGNPSLQTCSTAFLPSVAWGRGGAGSRTSVPARMAVCATPCS